MSRISNALARLNRDSAPHFLRILCGVVSERAWSLRNWLAAAWWGVEGGAAMTSRGKVYFRRAPGSTIFIGRGVRILSTFEANLHGIDRPSMISTLRPGAEIRLGDQVGMSGAIICAQTSVTIGNRVLIGANCTITDTDSHAIDFRHRHVVGGLQESAVARDSEPIASRPVCIEDDVFIGMHSLILKGVTIGRGAVIAAGSVVTKNVAPFSIVGGAPASTIYRLPL